MFVYVFNLIYHVTGWPTKCRNLQIQNDVKMLSHNKSKGFKICGPLCIWLIDLYFFIPENNPSTEGIGNEAEDKETAKDATIKSEERHALKSKEKKDKQSHTEKKSKLTADVTVTKNNAKKTKSKQEGETAQAGKGSTKWTDSKTEVQRTIVVTGLTLEVSQKDLRKLCTNFGTVEHVEFPVSERSEPTAFVRYVDYRNAIRAVQKLPGMKVKNSNVLSSVLLTKEDQRPSKKMLGKSRLIIRNLSFKCEEDELLEIFSKYGKVVNVHIPTKLKNNKTVKTGFGFVQFNNPANGKIAMENMNMKEIKGRKVVVDWAVGKEEYGAEKSKQGVFFIMCKTRSTHGAKDAMLPIETSKRFWQYIMPYPQN